MQDNDRKMGLVVFAAIMAGTLVGFVCGLQTRDRLHGWTWAAASPSGTSETGAADDARPVEPAKPLASLPAPKAAPDSTGKTEPVPEKHRAELMRLWNEVWKADGSPAVWMHGEWTTFEWTSWLMFPNPTFKGGSKEAYRAFAHLLLKFLRNEEVRRFLTAEGLWGRGVAWETADSPSHGGRFVLGWKSFPELAHLFSQPNTFGSHAEWVRQELRKHAEPPAPGGGVLK